MYELGTPENAGGGEAREISTLTIEVGGFAVTRDILEIHEFEYM